MDQKPRLFIYDRREMIILILLGMMVALFAFTLGVHLGKKVGFKTVVTAPGDTSTVATVPDALPNRQEFNEQGKNARQAADETMSRALHEEVTRTGVKLDSPKQVDLPKETHAKNGGATTPDNPPAEIDFKGPAAAPGKFTLQIGSFPAQDEARKQIQSMEAQGLRPFLKEANLGGKGTWYRVYVGGFASRDLAEKAGASYRSQHKIDSFIVAKTPER